MRQLGAVKLSLLNEVLYETVDAFEAQGLAIEASSPPEAKSGTALTARLFGDFNGIGHSQKKILIESK